MEIVYRLKPLNMVIKLLEAKDETVLSQTLNFWKKYHPFPFINTPLKLKFLQKSPPIPVY